MLMGTNGKEAELLFLQSSILSSCEHLDMCHANFHGNQWNVSGINRKKKGSKRK